MKRLALSLPVILALAAGPAACTPSGGGADDGAPPADAAPDAADAVPDAPGAPDDAPSDLPRGAGDPPPGADGACVPACDGRDCGDDGCGGTCGDCPGKDGFACREGRCTCLEPDDYGCPWNDERWIYPGCGLGEPRRVEICPYGCAGGACLDCTPSCEGRACGTDGCGGTCGDCVKGFACQPDGRCLEECRDRDCGGDGAGHLCGVCDEGVACNQGRCGRICPAPPAPAGEAGRLARLWIPSTAEEVAALCPDLTADGAGDNGVRGLAGQANPGLQSLADAGSLALLLQPAADGSTPPRLVLLRTAPVPGDPAGTLSVDPATWDPATCAPPSFLPVDDDGATLREAGPGALAVPFPATRDQWFDVRLQDLRLRAPRVPGAAPLSLGPSAVAGVVTRDEFERMMTWRGEFCATLDPQDSRDQGCGISTMVGPSFWFDLARNDDGTWRKRTKDDPRDGLSVCLAFEALGTGLASP